MISLGRDLIASMNGQNYSTKRVATGSYNSAGVYVPGTSSTINVFASVQPLGGKDLVRIPEGDRTRQRHKLYSADLMQSNNETTGATADIVTIDGGTFQVESVEKWTDYYKVIVVNQERAEVA